MTVALTLTDLSSDGVTVMSLTDTAIRAAKPGKKPVKIADEKGLYLLIRPSGGK
jgi:hypothetical protein